MNYTDDKKEVPSFVINTASTIHYDTTIEGNGLKVTYKGTNRSEATVKFDVFDEVSNAKEEFEFSMRYYESYNFMIDNS